MISGLVYAMASRTAVEVDVIRDRGSLYQMTPNDTVMNSYTLEMMNMSQHAQTYNIKVEGLPKFISDIPETVTLQSNELRAYPITIEVDPSVLTESKSNITFVIYNTATQTEVSSEESRFIAPIH